MPASHSVFTFQMLFPKHNRQRQSTEGSARNFMIILSVTIVSLSVFAADVSNNDRCYDGGSSRCLLTALRTTSRRITTPESASLRCRLAVLHGVADGRSAGPISLLSWPPTRHLLGFVSDCHCYYYLVVTLPMGWELTAIAQPHTNPKVRIFLKFLRTSVSEPSGFL